MPRNPFESSLKRQKTGLAPPSPEGKSLRSTKNDLFGFSRPGQPIEVTPDGQRRQNLLLAPSRRRASTRWRPAQRKPRMRARAPDSLRNLGAGQAPLFKHCLRGCKLRDRNAEGAATHVIQPGAVAEFHRGGIAPMFAANPNFQVFLGLPATLDPNFNELLLITSAS